jgi:CRISPR-associated protein Cmr1
LQIAEIELEILTPMFCYGNTKTAEFRVTELKSLMRSTFRELYYFENLNDMKEKESKLFGDIQHKSPIAFKIKYTKAFGQEKECMLPHRTDEKDRRVAIQSCFTSEKTKYIKFFMIAKNLNIYISLLLQASVIGSLGKRSRKGFGSFKVNSIKMEDEQNQKEYDKLIHSSPIDLLQKGISLESYKIRNVENKCDSQLNYAISKGNLNYPYVKNIRILKISQNMQYLNLIKNISELTHFRVFKKSENDFTKGIDKANEIDRTVLGNFKGQIIKRMRFAAPVHVSFWENNDCKYMIIKELNYDYIFDKLEESYKEIKKKYKRNIKANREYIDKYINELMEIGGGN